MYETYADDIFRYVYVHVNDVDTAEDLTADVFARAWNNLETFDFKHARGWLYKIAQNMVIDHWRRKKPLPLDESVDIASTDESLEEQTDRLLTKEQVQTAIHELPQEMRSVVTLRFTLGYSVKDTAESLGLSEANVRVVQHRALKKMRRLLS